jgi:hypothetical protein
MRLIKGGKPAKNLTRRLFPGMLRRIATLPLPTE